MLSKYLAMSSAVHSSILRPPEAVLAGLAPAGVASLVLRARKTTELDCCMVTRRSVDVAGATSAETESPANGDGGGSTRTADAADGPNPAVKGGGVFTVVEMALLLAGTFTRTVLGPLETAVAVRGFLLEACDGEVEDRGVFTVVGMVRVLAGRLTKTVLRPLDTAVAAHGFVLEEECDTEVEGADGFTVVGMALVLAGRLTKTVLGPLNTAVAARGFVLEEARDAEVESGGVFTVVRTA